MSDRARHRRRRSRAWAGWAGLLLVVVGGGLVAGYLAQRPGPEDAVSDYSSAILTGDCDLYREVTTTALRDSEDDGPCGTGDQTVRNEDFQRSVRDYEIEVTSASVDGDTARLTTRETYEVTDDATESQPGRHESRWRYRVVHADGRWQVDEAVLVGQDGEGLTS